MSLATLRLFKALPVSGAEAYPVASRTFERTIPKGFVFAPKVLAAYQDHDILIKMVDDLYGADPESLNKTFHKSFAKVRDASMQQLVIEQIVHYFTTYGREGAGTYDAERVFVPAERLDVPGIDVDSFPLVVIRGLTNAELREALLDLLTTGVALSEQSVKDAVDVASLVGFSDVDIDAIKNREVAAALCDLYGIVPANPVEFLRYVVYRLSGSTLLIKNNKAVAELKEAALTHNVLPLFNLYAREHGLNRLGEIFYRFKPLFLALRANSAMRPTINKIRRSAEQNHKPLAPDYLNNVTSLLKKADFQPGVGMKFADLRRELDNPNVNIFRKIRLAQALRLRTSPNLDSIVYKVRNGKAFAADFTPLTDSQMKDAVAVYNVVLMDIAQTLSETLLNRKVYIPNGVVYGLPATEKQFTGNFPAGTYVEAGPGQALVAGIYWEDVNRHRIDLDLSIANAGGKIGWDGSYRNNGRTVLFTGDNTSAPNGAAEAFWFDPSVVGSWLMSVNYYNFNPDVPVPYKVMVGTADAQDINSKFVFDPNRLLGSASSVIDVQQQNIGLIVAESGYKHRFYFGAANVGGGISARYGVNADRARRFMHASLLAAPTLNEVLFYAGATLVDRQEDADIDLSPSAVDKTTILSLLAGKAAV